MFPNGFRLIDLSLPIEHEAISEPMPARIRYITHDGEGLEQMQQLFGVKKEDLVWSGGLGWALEEITAITHTGTHVDAPYHYHPTSEGRPARRIDELPLEWFLAPAVRLDVRHIGAGKRIRISDLEEALSRIGYRLHPGDVVLLMTGRDRFCHSPEYYRQPGLGREEVLWLLRTGGAGDRHRRVHPGPTLCGHGCRLQGDRGRQAHLAGSFCRDRGGILSDRKVGQPRPDSGRPRLLDFVLSRKNCRGERGVVPGGGHRAGEEGKGKVDVKLLSFQSSNPGRTGGADRGPGGRRPGG